MLLRADTNERSFNLLLPAEVSWCAKPGPRRVFFFHALFLFGALLLPAVQVRCQTDKQNPIADSSGNADLKGATLRICLRLPDESPFLASAQIHVTRNGSTSGEELQGIATEVEGETLFPEVSSGSYRIEASSPGFLTAQLDSEIESSRGQRIIFLVMKPDLLLAKKPRPQLVIDASSGEIDSSWLPPGIDQSIPPVDPAMPCPLPEVLKGTSQQMTQFVNNLEKFTAMERLEHFAVNNSFRMAKPEVRKFQYVVTISRNREGSFIVDEFRNGSDARSQFPANVATEGLPAMALLFHPVFVNDFNFACEGMGQWHDRPAWQVHYIQKPERESHLRAYVTPSHVAYIALKGRAWIDPGSFQVLRLESELVEPVKKIQLLNERFAIEYMPVQFQSQKEQIWLPNVAELYVQHKNHRYYRRLTFTDFKLFSVDTSQNVHAPKEFYSFTNSSGKDISGTLTVVPANNGNSSPVSLSLTIPAQASIKKFVGLGNDVNLPPGEVASATFVHQGEAGAVKVDAHLSKESFLDVISRTPGSLDP